MAALQWAILTIAIILAAGAIAFALFSNDNNGNG